MASKRSKKGRVNSAARSYKKCHYCNREASTADHIIPKVKGGPNRPWNIVPSCAECNRAKGGRMPTCQCYKCTTAVGMWQRGADSQHWPNADVGPSRVKYIERHKKRGDNE